MKKRILSFLLALAICLLCIPAGALPTMSAATQYTSGDFIYTLANDRAMIYEYTGTDSDVVVPATLDGYPVYKITGYAFFCCDTISSVTIPPSVTEIDEMAFAGCEALHSVYITDMAAWCNIDFADGEANPLSYASELYLNDELVQDLVIPDGVTSIGNFAFYGYSTLDTVAIPPCVTELGAKSFSGTSLEEVRISDLAAWCNMEFAQNYANVDSGYYPEYIYSNILSTADLYINGELATDIVIPDGVTTISPYAFAYCTTLSSITIPTSVKALHGKAFYHCPALKTVYIDDLANWCEMTFESEEYFNLKYSEYEYCNLLDHVSTLYVDGVPLTDLVIPEGVTSISPRAFYNATFITSVTLPDTLTQIGAFAFYNCTSLKKVTTNSMKTYCNIDFTSEYENSAVGGSWDFYCNLLDYGADLYVKDKLATEVVIPSGTAAIGNYTFYNCDSLTKITIPDSVTTIYADAFYGCENLTDLYYTGTPEQWESVTVQANNEPLTDATLHYIEKPEEVFRYDIVNNKAYITKYTGSASELIIPDTLGDYPVVGIAEDAFARCDTLISVTIPDSVTSIEDSAFYYCTSLTSITIPDSVTAIGMNAFYNSAYYNNEENWTDKVLYIGNHLIDAKTSLSGKYTVRPGTKTIASSTFSYCDTLNSVIIPDSVTAIPKSAFNYCVCLNSVTIPNSVTTIGETAFRYCINLTSITIPNSVTSIDRNAFQKCLSLTSVTIPDSVTSLGTSAFLQCSDLISVTLSSGMSAIATSTFDSCPKLTSVTIPVSVTSIAFSAFSNCTALTDVYYGGTEEQWAAISIDNDNNALTAATIHFAEASTPTTDFAYTIADGTVTITGYTGTEAELVIPATIENYPVVGIADSAFAYCDTLTAVVIPDSVTTIGSNAFRGCSQLTSVELGKGVTAISDYAFYYCSRLTAVSIPGNVTTIGLKAFSDCSRLASVVMEEGVATIDTYAFYNCIALTTVTMPKSVTSIGSFAFTGAPIADVYYAGTQKQWAAISIGSDNKPLTDATIHYSEVDGCDHSWTEATCAAPKTCSICGETVGEALGHAWTAATCTAPKTCPVCSETEGIALGHDYVNGVCSRCNTSYADGFDTLVRTYTTGKVTFSIYESADGLYMAVISGTGAVPNWSGLSNYSAALHTLVVQEGLTSIPYGAYKDMAALETVSLPSTLTTINGTAFQNCTSLRNINLEEGLTTIGYAAFMGSGLTEVTIPNSVTTMSTWVFANCKNLVTAQFGASKLAKKTLPARTFSGCSALKEIDFGSVLRIIDDYAFNQCGLESLVLPSNIKTVDNAAFYKNNSLKTLEIADGGATYLGWASFYGCSALETVDLGDSLTSISTWVFTTCNSLTEITIPDTVTSIGRCAFKWCANLETVKLSDGMTDIKDEMFSGCSKLQNVTLPAGLTAIATKAFYNCRNLKQLDVPTDVTVAKDAFQYSGIK